MFLASTITVVIVTRYLIGTFLPLATEPLIEKLGYRLASTYLGVFTLTLALILIVIIRYG